MGTSREKICTKCGEKKDDIYFGLSSYVKKDGTRSLSSWCKKCESDFALDRYNNNLKNNKDYKVLKSEYDKEYRIKNEEKIKENKKNSYYKNIEIEKEKRKEKYNRNKEVILLNQKIYYKNNKTKILMSCKKYRELHKNERNRWEREYKRKRIKEDENFRLKRNISNAVWKQLNKIGSSKEGERTFSLIGVSLEEIKNRLEGLFADGMSWENYGEWHIDHIIPQVNFDFTNKDDIIACWHPGNLQPLWGKDNIIKGDKFDMEYLKSNTGLLNGHFS